MPTLIWEGDPGDLAPAERYTAIENWDRERLPKVGGSERFLCARTRLEADMAVQWGQGAPMVGPVLLRVTSWWPWMRGDGPAEGQPAGRLESVHTAVVDALARSGVLQDKEQPEAIISTKRYDYRRPRIEVEVKHWDDGGVAC